MSDFHGVKFSQQPTALVSPASVDAALPMAFGCAPIHRLDPDARAKAMPGSIKLCMSNAEAGAQLGIIASRDDFSKWGLSEQAFSQFALYGKAPGLYVNIFNPDVHNKTVTKESLIFFGGAAVLANNDIIDDITLTDAENPSTTYTAGTDYTIDKITGAITLIEDSDLAAAIAANKTITASYKYAAPELVTADDVIGGFDVTTGITTGLELVEQAFPRFRVIPGIIIAPNFSQIPVVAMVMAAKCVGISGLFSAVAYVDLPISEQLRVYSDIPAYKNKNGLTSRNIYPCWLKLRVGDRAMNMATAAAGVTAVEDRDRGGIPYGSPSNRAIQCEASIGFNDEEVSLTLDMANTLGNNGIATMLNGVNGNVLWGNYSGAAPGNTDPADSFIANRRMIAWFGNQLILTWFQKVDQPNNRRLIQSIVNSVNIHLNSLVSSGALTGGEIRFDEAANSLTDLMDGKIVFDVSLGLVSPAQNIQFRLQYEPAYLATLFS